MCDTCPSNPDTNGDSIYDGYELSIGLDPLDPNDGETDLDMDGLSNFMKRAVRFRISVGVSVFVLSIICILLFFSIIKCCKVFEYEHQIHSLGFRDEEEMTSIQQLGYKNKKEYLDSLTKGFANKREEIAAKLLGVSTAIEFIELVEAFADYAEEEIRIRKSILEEISRSIDYDFNEETIEKLKNMIPLDFEQTYEEFKNIFSLMLEIRNEEQKIKIEQLFKTAEQINTQIWNTLNVKKQRQIWNFSRKHF